MPSPKQIQANRHNAQRSTGPKTNEGKAQSRLNALKHGLRAEGFDVLPNENADAYRTRLEFWIDDFKPADAAEEQLVRHAADLTWKLDRAKKHETASLSIRVHHARNEVAAKSLTLDPDLADSLASFDPSIEGERLRRYQFALSREFVRTIDTIKKLKRERLECARKANSEATEGDGRTGTDADRSSECVAPNEPISSSENAPNEPISSDTMQVLFGPEPVRVAEPPQTAAPNEPNRPRPMTQRDRAIAKMLKRAKSRR